MLLYLKAFKPLMGLFCLENKEPKATIFSTTLLNALRAIFAKAKII